MIARTWRGEVAARDADAYVDYLRVTGIRAYRRTRGNRGVLTLTRRTGEQVEFLMVSLWDSWAAIEDFAGPVPDVAVFYPEDERFLVRRDHHAGHFRVVDARLPTRGLVARWWSWWWGGWEAFWRQREEGL